MGYSIIRYLLFIVMLGVTMPYGCTTTSLYKPIPQRTDFAVIEYSGGGDRLSKVEKIDNGFLIPDGRGGTIWVPGSNPEGAKEAVIQAQELRLKVKELAAQLLDIKDNSDLIGIVALPTSFVNLNNFSESSPLGRYMSEGMIYEFNQRGFPIKEYRMDNKIYMSEIAGGEFSLQRTLPPFSINQTSTAILVGTYLKENNTIFINARLVRSSDGIVLRTAQIVLPENALLTRMTKTSEPSLSSDRLRIVPKSKENTKSIPDVPKYDIPVESSVKTQLPKLKENKPVEKNRSKGTDTSLKNTTIDGNIVLQNEDISKITTTPPSPGMSDNL